MLVAHTNLLEQFGPQLGRPRVDTLKGSRHKNMKELRFDGAGGVWRFAFAFDPERSAIILCGGDKSGVSEKLFYRQLITKADARFDSPCRAHHTAEEGKEINMPTKMKDIVKAFNPERRKRIKSITAELMAEEMTLRELRKAQKLTQERIAETLGIGQDQVSRLEQRSDLLLSTLRSYVEAMGGSLTIVAKFPDRKPVEISGLATAHSLTQ